MAKAFASFQSQIQFKASFWNESRKFLEQKLNETFNKKFQFIELNRTTPLNRVSDSRWKASRIMCCILFLFNFMSNAIRCRYISFLFFSTWECSPEQTKKHSVLPFKELWHWSLSPSFPPSLPLDLDKKSIQESLRTKTEHDLK